MTATDTPGTAPPRDPASVAGLLEQLVRDLTALLRSEARLARAEMMSTLQRALRGLAMILAAGAVFLLAALVLIQALVVALASVTGPGWAALIVGVALAGIGALLLAAGRRSLRQATLVPERTLEQISRDGRLVQEQI